VVGVKIEQQREHSPARRYLTALLAPLIVAAVIQLSWPHFAQSPFAPFLLAVTFSAWYGGLNPGLLSVFVSAVLANFFFVEPYFRLWPTKRGDFQYLLTLATVGPFISLMSELMHRQRRRAEINFKTMCASEDRYRKLAENFPNGAVSVYDKDLRLTFIGGKGLEKNNLSADSFIGKSLHEIAPPEVVDIVEPHFRAAFAGEVVTYECRYPDGRIYFASAAPLFDPNGAINEILVIAQNVTEMKRTEEDLKKQKEILQTIFERIPIMISAYDRDNNVTLMNREWERTRGWSHEEIQKQHIDILAEAYPDPEDLKRARAFIAEASGEWADFEIRVKDGRVLNTSWASVRLSDGMRINIGQDITKRKQREEKLREYEKVVENLDEMIVVVDREYRYLLANQAFLDYRALKREQVVGHLLPDMMNKDLFESVVKKQLDDCFKGNVVKYEMTYSYPERGDRQLLVSYFPIEGGGGVDRVACVLRDITEHQQAEKARHKAEQKYRDIFENAGEGIFQTTPEGRYIEANPALARMHGFEYPEDLIKGYNDISHEVYVDPGQRQEFKELIESQGFVREFEHQIFRRDGSKIWIAVNARVVRDGLGKILFYEGIVQNINKRKLAEARSAIFSTLGRKLSGATTQLHAGRIIADTARELFGWDACNLDLYDADRDIVHPMLNVDTIDGEPIDITASFSDSKPTARQRLVIDHGPLLLSEDQIEFDDDASPFGEEQKPFASMMLVPVRHASSVVGMLSIHSYTPQAYDAAALNNLQSLADHCAEALNRIHAEESFYESEEKFRQLAEHFEDVVWLTDKDISKVVYINPAYERIVRRTCESLQRDPTSFSDVIHPEDRESFERLHESEVNGDYQPAEYRIIWPDGTVRWLLRRSFPIRNTKGEIYLVAGIAQDITDRKGAQEALRESEELFSKAFHSSPAPLIITRLDDGKFLNVNDEFLRTFEYERAEVMGKTVHDLSIYVSAENRMTLIDDLQEQTALCGYESKARTKSGRVLDLLVFVERVTLKGEQCLLSTAYDTTDRKIAEKALRESEERYRELFDNAKDAIYVHDLSGRYVSLNRAAEKLSGYSRDEIIGKHFSNFVAPRDLKHVRKNLCRKLDEEGETTYEIDLVTRSRQRVPVEVVSRLIYQSGEPIGVQGTARDITERRRAQEALQIYSRRLIEAQEAERQSLARELHDEIGQVLTAVRINLHTVQNSYLDDASLPRIEESIVIVDEALGRIRELSLELRPSLLDDLGLAAALRWYVDRYGQRTGIKAEVLTGFEERGRLPRDLETECFRIAQEALTNVARHARATRVCVQLDGGVEKLVLTVTDNGIGFDTENLISGASSAATLGLRGMRERALAMNGRIEINSSPGAGTQVRATLPLKRPSYTR
jgi:PAS domain S-box-containing protein